jgi:ABC-type lipoprotein release transport system permease subunit
MGVAWYWARADLRHRRAAALGLVVLVAIALVVPLTAAAAARRTASSLDRMRAELRPYHADVQFEDDAPPTDALERIRAIPGVEVAGEGASLLARPQGSDAGFLTSFGQGARSPEVGTELDRMRLHEGRTPEAANEVTLAAHAARSLGVVVGDRIVLETLSWDGLWAAFDGEDMGYDGPAVPLVVVGIGDQPEGLTAGVETAPSFVVSTAFFEEWTEEVAFFEDIYLVRLEGGASAGPAFEAEVRAAFPERDDVGVHLSEEQYRIADAVRAQVLGLSLLAGAAGIAALFACAQAVARHVRGAGTDTRTMAALGAGRRARLAGRLLTLAPLLALGALGAVGVATLASGWFPTGAAGRVEPDPGVLFDPLVAAAGVVVLAGVALGASAWAERPPAPARRSRVAEALGAVGLPVPILTGIRAAVQPAVGRHSVPVRSTMAASVAGIAGLLAAVLFGAALHRLIETPARYGFNFDLAVSVGDRTTDEQALETAAQLRDIDEVDSALLARVNNVFLDGREQFVFATEVVVGEPTFTVVSGRTPGDGEVALGGRTMTQLGVGVGDTVLGEGIAGGDDVPLRVVGQVLFPVVENEDPAQGAWTTLPTYHSLRSVSEGFPEVFVDLVDGVELAAVEAALSEVGFVTPEVRPAVVGNLQGVATVPYVLAAFLAVLAVVAMAHALLMALRRRHQELAVLKALGLTRRDLGTTVVAQSATFAVVGLVVGVPLGAVVGTRAWSVVAGDLGFATDAALPPWIALVVPSTLALAAALALLPARSAAATSAARMLRAE